MNAIASPISAFFVATAVGLVWVTIVGMLRARDPFDRLHFPGAAVLVGAPAIAVALSLAAGGSMSLRAWLISAVLVLTNGILTHATARAEWLRSKARAKATDGQNGDIDGDR